MLNISDNKNNNPYIKLEDYKSFDYEIPNIFLDFIIEDKRVIVKTELKLIKKNININSLILDGIDIFVEKIYFCLLYTSPSPRDLSTSRMPSSA